MVRPLGNARRRFLLRPLNVIFGAPSHVALLRALAQAGRGLTGREVARAARVAQRAALDGLVRLEQAGVVRRTPAGRAFLYELRRERHLVRTGILPLLEREAEIRSGIFERLREALGKDVVSGCVFGSAARGEERPESDLDVLLLVEGKDDIERLERRVASLFETLRREFDVRASPIIMKQTEFVRGYRTGREFMRNVVRDAETFAGKPLKAVVDG
ncbi:MAG: nucleotidyltransferase domain-containing protein [Planctomycetes bacterium]|nr:nucleotidyltransferase domain-containing protein [Planctomycetota bacterium]